MLKKIIVLIFPLSLVVYAQAQTTTTPENYEQFLIKKEKEASERQVIQAGKLVSSISFKVKTKNRKDYRNGLIPWASLEKAEHDIFKLKDGNKIAIPDHKITIIIDYPLNTEHRFELESAEGFTRAQLVLKSARSIIRSMKSKKFGKRKYDSC